MGAAEASLISTFHPIWQAILGKNWQARNDTKMRRFRHNCFGTEEGWMDKYLEGWIY